jgi:two-component system, chemotaxis family, sensor kinase CheA
MIAEARALDRPVALPANETSPETWEQRATAAEKTVRVLKKKVHALMSGAEKSIIEKQLIQVQKRSDAMAKRRELMELRAAELERYSAKLEGEVRERTRTIRTILDNVTFGFMLVDRALVVQPGYTQSCHQLVGESSIVGRSLVELLALSPRDGQGWLIGVDQVFDDLLPEDVSVGQLPARFPLGARVLRIDARPVRDEAGAIQHLLLSIADISALEAAELEARDAKALVDILRQREPFRTFVRDTRARLDQALSSDDASVVRSAVHTIKGNAGCFGLFEVAALAHDIEADGVVTGAIPVEGLRRLEGAMKSYLTTNLSVLQLDLDDRGDPGAVLLPEQLRRLIALTTDAGPELKELVTSLTRRSAAELVGPVGRLVDRLAAQLGKHVSFTLDGGDALIDTEHQSVFAVLGHLVRNSIDHGIEDSGKIEIDIREEQGRWLIRVSDDGRGIDADNVARQAVSKSLCSADEAAAMSREDRLRLVFLDGVSTAQVTTDISGRGVGMSAVMQAVRSANGDLRIDSEPGRGTRITLDLPMR